MALFNEENILFLDEVHRYDCLFNKFNKDFKNKFKKYNCWIKIEEKFGVSPEEAEKKFRNIRTAYGSDRSAVPKFDVNLDWLSSTITHRKTIINLAVDADQDVESAGTDDVITGLEEDEVMAEMTSSSNVIGDGEVVDSGDESQENPDVDIALIETAKSVAKASNKFSPGFQNAKDVPEDENSLFCRSLVQRMQRLPP
eukprot:gene15522-6785_t